ncbi:MAG: hypothetical protein BroJett013_07270 [Alphaproteobacteria bacterium]|nr:MAG: hypothetical protein BroJett013_07270 [Alphaproteobacteria bacterium]
MNIEKPTLQGALYKDLSGTIATGGAAQELAPRNLGRDHLFIGNPNASGSLWVNDLGGAAAANGAGSTEIPPGEIVKTYARNAISIVHADTGAKFTAGEA